MNFNRYISAAEAELLTGFFNSQGESVRLVKGACFSEQGICSRYSGFVEEGGFRYVCMRVGYAFAGEFVGDYISMCTGKVSQVSIEAMCTCCMQRVSYEQLETFYRTDAGHERLGRLTAEHLLAAVYDRYLQMYAFTLREHYEALMERCPDMLNLIPLCELASYLRIRSETLSRIRRKLGRFLDFDQVFSFFACLFLFQ